MLGNAFYVMDRVDGVIPSDHPPFAHGGWLFDATPEQQGRLVRSALGVLAELHRLDWRALGFGLLERPEYGATPFRQQLGYYQMMLRWAAAGRAMPVVDATQRLVAREASRPTSRRRASSGATRASAT